MSKRQRLIQEKRRMAELWERFPVLSELYETPDQYAETLRQIEEKVQREDDRAEVRRIIQR